MAGSLFRTHLGDGAERGTRDETPIQLVAAAGSPALPPPRFLPTARPAWRDHPLYVYKPSNFKLYKDSSRPVSALEDVELGWRHEWRQRRTQFVETEELLHQAAECPPLKRSRYLAIGTRGLPRRGVRRPGPGGCTAHGVGVRACAVSAPARARYFRAIFLAPREGAGGKRSGFRIYVELRPRVLGVGCSA